MCQRLEILERDQLVFFEAEIDNHYFLGNTPSDPTGPFMVNLTGVGKQLVISKWTGGAHCCTSLLIFDLEKEFRKIAEIEGGNFEPEIFKNTHDIVHRIRIIDDFLAYRFSSFASSAHGTVILKYSEGR